MTISAKVLADSIAPSGKRLTTMEWTYPRAIHSEIMTHRAFSRNAASSRAIPTEKLIQRIIDDPWVPSYIGANQKGMQAGAELADNVREDAVSAWLAARDQAVYFARYLLGMNIHKQVINRLLEPWMHITIIVSATEWNNFFALRLHKDAEPHFQALARAAKVAMEESKTTYLKAGEWHLPLVDEWGEDGREVADKFTDINFDDMNEEDRSILGSRLAWVSIGRCARVSYLTHDGKRDVTADYELCRRLIAQEPLHASPAEHVAVALNAPERHGNLIGWKSYRMLLPNESVPG